MGTNKETLKNERNRHMMRLLAGAVLILIEAVIFYYVWTNFYNPLVRRPYLFKGNFFITGVYAAILLLFGSIYGGLKLGYYRVFDLILSQSLATFITNIVIYVAMIIPIATWYLSPAWILCMTLLDILVIMLWAMISNKVFVSIFPPQRLILFHGGHEDMLGAKFIQRPDRYSLCRSVDVSDESLFVKEEQYCSDSEALSGGRAEASQGGRAERLLELCKGYDGVIIGDIPAELRNDLLKACFSSRLRTYTLPKLTDVILKSSETLHIFDSPVFLNRNHGLTAEQRLVKRSMDLLCSALGLVILSPLLLLTAAAIKLEDGGPVFYKQRRCTEGGRIFEILKFRSMIPDAEKEGISVPATDRDPRITRVGAFIRATRIDELPQLINILRGDMSIVGPRPERIEHVQKYSEEIPEFSYRMLVKGGLTGYAQVYGKYNTTAYDKLKLDLMYIQNYSIILDMELILKTIKILFTKESTEGFTEESSKRMGEG